MPTYNYKNHTALAYDENKKRLRLEASIVLAEIMNEALKEMTREFNDGLARKHLHRLSAAEARAFLSAATRKMLEA